MAWNARKGEKKWQIEVAPDGKLLLRAEEMNLTNLSVVVQKTIQQSATNGKIESIANVTEDGQSYYEAAVTFNGQEKTFIVGADGKLIDTQSPRTRFACPSSRVKRSCEMANPRVAGTRSRSRDRSTGGLHPIVQFRNHPITWPGYPVARS